MVRVIGSAMQQKNRIRPDTDALFAGRRIIMANDLNRVMLIGRMTADAEMRTTKSGKDIATFSIACNKSYTNLGEKHETVSFFKCQVWGKSAGIINEYTKKGSKLAIEGRLQQTRFEDANGNKKEYVEIVVENFQFLDGKKESSTSSGKPTDSKNNNHGPDSFEEKIIRRQVTCERDVEDTFER